VSGIDGVRHILSQITDGVSVTTIEFRLDTNSDRALNDVKDAVTRTRSNLPRNIDGEPLVQRVDVVDLPIVTYAAISPGKTPERLSWFVDDVVQRKLQGVRGVAAVERIGGVDREILVSLDPYRLKAVGLTAADVSKLLRGTNVDVAGGRAEIGGRDQVIRTLAERPSTSFRIDDGLPPARGPSGSLASSLIPSPCPDLRGSTAAHRRLGLALHAGDVVVAAA
jgi:multidrug efflux pump subunit AcrB